MSSRHAPRAGGPPGASSPGVPPWWHPRILFHLGTRAWGVRWRRRVDVRNWGLQGGPGVTVVP